MIKWSAWLYYKARLLRLAPDWAGACAWIIAVEAAKVVSS